MKYASKKDKAEVKGAAATYYFRVPTKRDKIELARRVRAAGGRIHSDAAIASRVAHCVDRMFADDQKEKERLGLIVRQFSVERARMEQLVGAAARLVMLRIRAGDANATELDEALRPHAEELERFMPLAEDYSRIERLVEELDQGIRDMRSDNENFWPVHHLTAVEMLLCGWEPWPGKELPKFRMVAGRVPVELIESMPDEDIGAIGDAIVRAMGPSEQEIKNSASPHGTPASGESSTMGESGQPSDQQKATAG